MDDSRFRRLVMQYWRRHGRHDLPWRTTSNPYRILVSEVMLQQTQVSRVIPKYRGFLRAFPTLRTLASAQPSAVLKQWQGLGYNRRALMLRQCAQAVVRSHGGQLPDDYDALCALPGIGPYTAGAVLAFAFNRPYPVIETNIRRAYLHHFFPRRRNVSDSDILPIVTRHSLFVGSPRDWYSALMDYGSWLGETTPKTANPNRRSRHYVRQAAFEGSLRQLRGRILRALLEKPGITAVRLYAALGDSRIPDVLPTLEREGFIVREKNRLRCA